MGILFCRIGWATSYNGDPSDALTDGGEYNKDNIGHEIHNYQCINCNYYGYVQSTSGTIDVSRLDKSANDMANSILVVWCARKKDGGIYIIGWYKNATVYRTHQAVPREAMALRSRLPDHNFFNICTKEAYLLPCSERNFEITGFGRANIWYGNEETINRVEEYINNYTQKYETRIETIEQVPNELEGAEKEVIIKARINQDKFRDGLINKFGKCCLCGVKNKHLLIASHLKPWSLSDKKEKLDIENGLLLCPNHDKLLDEGFISFDKDGKILISDEISENDMIFMNIQKNMQVEINEGNANYISFHRDNIFRKTQH